MKDFRFKISDFGFLAGLGLLAIGLSVSLSAQPQPPASTPPVSPAVPVSPAAPVSPAVPAATDVFRPMSELAAREVLPATPLVFYAYAFVWVVLIGYVLFLWRRMARVEQDLAAVERRLQESAARR